MALIVLDASVVIAHLDPADALDPSATSALLDHSGDDLRLPAFAYAESLIDPARKGRLEEAREAVTALKLEIVPIDRSIAERAATFRAREPHLRLPDALVLACGHVIGADAILSGDSRWRRFTGVRLIS